MSVVTEAERIIDMSRRASEIVEQAERCLGYARRIMRDGTKDERSATIHLDRAKRSLRRALEELD